MGIDVNQQSPWSNSSDNSFPIISVFCWITASALLYRALSSGLAAILQHFPTSSKADFIYYGSHLL